MKLAEVNECTGCWACASICPRQCIHMKPDAEGFLRPTVDASQCVVCGICRKVCPVLHAQVCDRETIACAAIHKDENIRRESTSGGMFSLICQWIFARGGVVFGAAYADDFSVEHRCARSMGELSALRTAKYAQSRIGDSFQKIKQLLTDGQYVLFSGTPCQVDGLRSFLGKDYERLILVDLICHGVPSPAVWSRYIDYRSKTDAFGAPPVLINLRSKETGWPEYSVHFDYENGAHYSARNAEDPFMRCFVGDLCLRLSCYDCRYKGISRVSDFTLGDYWGIERQLPELHDGKGTSLVMIHSAKAKRIWEGITPQLRCREVDPERAVAENPSAIKSSEIPESRKAFMSRFAHEDFAQLVDELIPPLPKPSPPALPRRILNKIKRSIHIKRGS